MECNKDLVEQAYLHLKSYAYYDNLNLFLKRRVAAFECGHFDHNIQQIINLLNSSDPANDGVFLKWLESINYNFLPKSINRPEDKKEINQEAKGLFISNVRDSKIYEVNKVNFFIQAPIELHIIEVLWCMFVGAILDDSLSDACYGNRMSGIKKRYKTPIANKQSGDLFKKYIDQYNKWRDQAIDHAKELSEKKQNVVLLSLDLKSFYYQIDLKFETIRETVIQKCNGTTNDKQWCLLLTDLLEAIHKKYHDVISKDIANTHGLSYQKIGIPIGFCSSSIIANWYLRDFDEKILENILPEYYGRYVDDILLVFKTPPLNEENPIEEFINNRLHNLLLLEEPDGDYYIEIDSNKIYIQKEKLILQYFDKNHSRAILEVFKHELDERSSAFKFLPSDHIDIELDKFAYDVIYEGSVNKLRSVVGLAENETELSRYLSSHITAHRLCRLDKNSIVLPQLNLFFKGANVLQFSRLWEKVYQYSLIVKNYKFIQKFNSEIKSEIDKIVFNSSYDPLINNEITEKIKSDLLDFNRFSLSLTLSLLDIRTNFEIHLMLQRDFFYYTNNKTLIDMIFENDLVQSIADFRMSNLLRHNLVAWPLANFSDFNGNLTDELAFISEQFEQEDREINATLTSEKLEKSPRFIHYDEWQLFHLPNALKDGCNLNKWQQDSLEKYKLKYQFEDFSVKLEIPEPELDSKFEVIKSVYSIGKKVSVDKVCIGIANMVIEEKNIAAAIRKDKKPNISFDRQEDLYHILNSATKAKTDLLIMPEVSIPVSWLPFMISHARRHQVGLVFGLEHWVIKDNVYNLIIEALPFKTDRKYKSCVMTARLKNHYAPQELKLIDSLRLKPANLIAMKYYYHRISWKGMNFSTYNCFELSDITHRALFKSELDLLIACVWNKDTNYYHSILDSAVRDIHCYMVQSNTAQYGGSCVLRPTKTESKTMLYVKGGINNCVLTTDIDIKSLRDFQYKSKPDENDIFKHVPPGFDCDKVLNR